MTRLRLKSTLAIISMVMCFTVMAQEQPAWEVNALNEDGGAVYDFQTGITTATNGVIIKRGNAVLTADGVTIYHQTGEAFATGNVRIEQGDQLWVGDEMKYNFNTHQMEGRQFRTGMPPVFMSGNNLHADMSGKAYAATNGFFQGAIDGSLSRIPAHFLINEDLTIQTAYYGTNAADHIGWEAVQDFVAQAPSQERASGA